MTDSVSIPMQWVGPVAIVTDQDHYSAKVPLATFETTLWPSVNRGAKLSRLGGGIQVACLKNFMTRSIVLEGKSALTLQEINARLNLSELQAVVAKTSRYATLCDWHSEIVGNLLYLRFAFETGAAAGHNMTTKAADALSAALCEQHPELKYVSISGNLCVDKKVSSINGILGRGQHMIAELTLSPDLCQQHLHTTPQAILALNVKKNLLGSILNGGVRSANAHYANILLAFYLATGQDAANIVEGSQGITYAEVLSSGALYFSVNLPNVIVGTLGHGKHHEWVRENLRQLECAENEQGRARLAQFIAATVLCGELSLMAAQTNIGELTRSHMIFERNHERT